MKLRQVTNWCLWFMGWLWFLVPVSASGQCALCWSSLANAEGAQSLIEGFNAGILFLLAIPFAIAGTLGWIIMRNSRRHL